MNLESDKNQRSPARCGYVLSDGVKLYYEDIGVGDVIIFIHEYAGDYRSWEKQINYFSKRFRCVTYNARGYPPSEVPLDPKAYSMEQAARDAIAVMDALDVGQAHIIGLSMGSFASLQMGIDFAQRCLTLVPVGCGHGANPEDYRESQIIFQNSASRLLEIGMQKYAEEYANGPWRITLKRKNIDAWVEFKENLAHHDPQGSALTLLGVQASRPSLWSLEPLLKQINLPVFLITGDEDTPTLVPNIYLKSILKSSRLAIIPGAGHAVNLEEPEQFNRIVDNFLQSNKDSC